MRYARRKEGALIEIGHDARGTGEGHAPCEAAGERELDLGVVELLHVDSLGHGRRHCCSLDDLQAGRAHPVPGRHFLQEESGVRYGRIRRCCDFRDSSAKFTALLARALLPSSVSDLGAVLRSVQCAGAPQAACCADDVQKMLSEQDY